MATRVQTSNSGDTDTATQAFGSNVTAGNLLIVATRIFGTSTNSGVTDTVGSIYTLVRRYAHTGNAWTLEVWKATAAASGANTVTMGGGAIGRVLVEEVSGLTTPTVDQQTAAEGTSASASSGSITAAANSWVFNILALSSYPTVHPTATSSFTAITTEANRYAVADLNFTAGGSVAGTWTLPESNTWGVIVASFKSGATSRTLTADQGSYSVVGSQALVDIEMAGASSSYAITGYAVNLSKGFKVAADPGAYVLVGYDAVTDWSGGGPKVIVCDGGTYSIVGQDASLRRAARSIANTGIYTLSGFSVVGGTQADEGTISTIFRVRKVLVVPTTGRTRWVHYIPVKNIPVTAQNIATFNQEGALEVESIGSGTGLVEWVDYIPIVEVSDGDSGKWRYDNAGWIPVVYVD